MFGDIKVRVDAGDYGIYLLIGLIEKTFIC